MPVKRRTNKHGGLTDDRREALLYGPESVLLSGFGFYYRCGANWIADQPPEAHRAAEAAMREDWQRHGSELLAHWTGSVSPWALIKFGDPHAA